MIRKWPEIEAFFGGYEGHESSIRALLALVRHISGSSLASGLYGWTSTFNLCLTQTEVSYPYNGPYLQLAPLTGGRIELRFVDTMDSKQQWHRTVDADELLPQFLGFLGQLNWFSAAALARTEK